MATIGVRKGFDIDKQEEKPASSATWPNDHVTMHKMGGAVPER